MAKWALITGASSGIGEATAQALAGAGFNLILNARRLERLQELEKKFKKSVDVVLAPFDVRDLKAARDFVSQHQKVIAQVEVLVNNAGLAKGTDKVQDARPEDWDLMIDTNVKGLLYLTRLIVPPMIENKRGHIVNLGSVAGRWSYAGGAVYCATKFAVRAITEGLRMDLLGTPIRVTNIEPGMVETEFSEVRVGDKDKAAQIYKNMKPLVAADVADTILWVVQRPKHVNIQELVIFPTDQAAIGMINRGASGAD